MKKQAKRKNPAKRNPADGTIRNIRAANKRNASRMAELRELRLDVNFMRAQLILLAKAVEKLERKRKKKD